MARIATFFSFLMLFAVSIASAQFPYSNGSPMLPGASTSMYKAGATPLKSSFGAFSITCFATHISHDDPIKLPGQYYGSYEHMYYGNALADAKSTYSTLSTTGNSSCYGGILDRTAYSTATLLTGANQEVLPYKAVFSYNQGGYGVKAGAITAFPAGLQIAAGDPTGIPGQSTYHHSWICSAGGTGTRSSSIPDCATWALNTGENPLTTTLALQIAFPQCWDGKNLYLSTGAHMAYAAKPNGCPASNPVALPQIVYTIFYLAPYTAGAASGTNFVAGYHVFTDSYNWTAADTNCAAVSGSGKPISLQCSSGGYSAQAEWFGALTSTLETAILNNCLKASMNCTNNEIGMLNGAETVLYGTVNQNAFGTIYPAPPEP